MLEKRNLLAIALTAFWAVPCLAAKKGAAAPAREYPRELSVQLGHSLPVTGVALSADGKLAATAGRDGWAILWDARRGYKLRAVMGDRLGLTCAALSADGKKLLTGGAGTAILWDAATGKALRRFGDPGEFLLAVWMSPDGRAVTTVSQTAATVWDGRSGRRLRVFPVATKATAAAVSADEKTIALAEGSEISVWSTTAGVRVALLDAGNPVRGLAFTKDGSLATATEEGLRVWDARRGLELASFKSPAARTVLALPNDRLASSGGNTARLWDVAGRRPLGALIGHLDSVGALAVSADGRTLLTGSDDHTARVWALASPAKPALKLGGATLPARFAAATADGRRLVAVDDRTARLWNLDEGTLVRASTGDWSLASKFSLSNDGRLLACLRDRDMVDLRDLESGQDLGTFQWNLIKATSVSLDPRGKFLVTGYDQRIQIWTIPEGQPGPAVDPTPGRLASVLVALGGRRIAAVDDTGEIRFWSLDEGRWLGRAALGGSSLPRLILSRDGRFLAAEAAVRASRSIRVFDLESGEELKSWQLDREAAPIAFGPDGASLLALDEGGAWEWEIMSGRKMRAIELRAAPPLEWPQAADPRWRFLLGEADGEIRFLSLDDGKQRGRLVLSDKGWYAASVDGGRVDGSPELFRWTRGLESQSAGRGGEPFAPGLLSAFAGRRR